ncbi:MAG: hypothetical protein WC553_03530 [Patescibacteria group bacterium]
MPHLLHHFRRNRTYNSHERWGVFSALFILTIAVSAGGWLLSGQPVASATTLAVTNIKLPPYELYADGKQQGEVVLTVTDKTTSLPATGIWVGLQIADPTLRTNRLTYFDWYSPESERAFFLTNDNGKVSFPLMSDMVGSLEYKIYTANPEAVNDAKYQSLDKSFVVKYE